MTVAVGLNCHRRGSLGVGSRKKSDPNCTMLCCGRKKVVFLLVSLAVSCHGGYYGKSYPAPSVKVVVKPPAPIFRHEIPVAPIVRHVAPVVHHLPAPLPVVHALPAPLPVVHAAPIAAVPSPIFSKYHSQDELGQASFGHVTADQSASNFRDASGNQVGHYSYINPDGQEVVVQYTAGKDGFRVLSNFLPVAPVGHIVGPAHTLDTAQVTEAKLAHFAAVAEAKARKGLIPVHPINAVPVLDTTEVAEAKAAHFAAVAEAKARNAAPFSRKRRSPYGGSYSAPPVKVVKHVAPLPVVRHVAPAPLVRAPVVHALPVHALPAPLPVVHAAPIAAVPSPIFSKFHSQDELGQASFGHVTADQSAANFRDAFGNQVGHYSYINPDGQEIVVQYTAGADGFRVLSNFLPVASAGVGPAGPVLVGPAPVLDTPEVHQAKLAHFAAVAEAKARLHH